MKNLGSQPRALLYNLKSVRFFPLLLLSFLLFLPAHAQNYEGTLSQTQNGLTATAKLSVEAPDKMRVEIARDDALNLPAQVIVASGDQTLRYEPATKRLFRARYNVLKKWNRGWTLAVGGPANFVFAGAPAGTVTETEGRYNRRDKVLFGGGGENAYYAATKVAAGLYPAKVELSGAPVSKRVDFDVAGAPLVTAQINYDGALPAQIEVDAAGEFSTFNYDLKTRADAFPAATWTIPEAASALAEDLDLQGLAAYSNVQDPNDLLNGGVALWRGAGDFGAAQARFAAARKIAPQASAPMLATFEMALQTRQLALAQSVLEAMAPLNLDAAELETRRARLALLRRDWDGALAALDKALASVPDAYVVKMARAQALLGKGDVKGARTIWAELIMAPIPVPARMEARVLQGNASAGDSPPRLFLVPKLTNGPEAPLVIMNGEIRAALALDNERAGQDEAARALWEEVEKSAPDALKNTARAHLMTLAARRGDANASLAAYARLRDALPLQSQRETATQALFDAWQKAFRREDLGAVIRARAAATRANDDDARLALAYQEFYGDNDAIEAAVTNGYNRAPDAPFWLGKRAEIFAGQAFPLVTSNNASATRRAALLQKAREALATAIAGDKKAGGQGLFYQQQLALINAQSAAKLGGVGRVIDPGASASERRAAREAVENLVAAAPDDPDILVSAALAWQSFGGDEGAAKTIELTTRALLLSPDDGPRHGLILAARQAMAFALTRLNRAPEAAAQWELLLLEAQSAGEQAGIAANYFTLLEKAGDGAGAALLLRRIAAEPWDYSEARGALEALSRRAAVSPLLAPIETTLAEGDVAALLAWNQIAQRRLERAQAALQVPDAPAVADADLERAKSDVSAALNALAQASARDYLAARAAAWLAEYGGLPGDAALEQLRRAVAIESRAPALRLALADAQPTDEAAQNEVKLAAQIVPDGLETARRLSVAALDAGDKTRALEQSARAFNAAARDPLTRNGDFERIAFARARILWETGDTASASEIYNGLALPQWADFDRAAALLALRARYAASERPDDAARLEPKIAELGFDLPALQRAAAFVEEVEN